MWSTFLPRQMPSVDISRWTQQRFSSSSAGAIKNIDKLLIANRGEIACRIMKTCQRLGIATVAVFSDADSDALHVDMADQVYNIGAAPKDSYLDGDNLIRIAKEVGAQAIHPGYGFLSENEQFASAVEAAGLTFVGPPSSAIRDMGSKSASKNIMIAAGVQCVPGYHGEDQSTETLLKEAEKITYPVMLKAVLGGGGKGMRIVKNAKDFPKDLEACRTEAMKSFKDDRVLVEKYIENPRHVEIQVFADNHGDVVYLFERDCSVQRRHQKVIEEAPAPGLTPERRKAMGDAACDAARAVGYRGAGTVEFILDNDTGAFYFMEMNTRLQVEHPVTELITKQDLVHWQLKVAQNEPLPLKQEELKIHGHSFEARIYAEDPDNGFLPGTGTLEYLRPPTSLPMSENHVRVDTGVREGDEVSVYYDPMISKLIVWDEDRHTALRRMELALKNYYIGGLTTNIKFLLRLAQHPQFKAGDVHTNFIPQHHDALIFKPSIPPPSIFAIASISSQMLKENAVSEQAQHTADPHSPWSEADSFRYNLPAETRERFTVEGFEGEVVVTSSDDSDGGVVVVQTAEKKTVFRNVAATMDDGLVEVSLNGITTTSAVVHKEDGDIQVILNGEDFTITPESSRFDSATAVAGSLVSPMPGEVVKVEVKVGDHVEAGQLLMVLEAMKMLNEIKSPSTGVVTAIYYNQGQLVNQKGEALINIEVDA